VIAAVAEEGYAQTTVARVVSRARVSRKAFYDHFDGLEDCFLSAMAAAQDVIVRELMAAPVERGASSRDRLRAGIGAYLALCAQEPEYARCILVELPAVSRRALKGRNRGYRAVAEVMRAWRTASAERHPDWPEVPDVVYPAAVGAIAEMILLYVSRGEAARLPELRDDLTDIVLRMLAVPVPPD
jgi:AcrR family transcriptional regulator